MGDHGASMGSKEKSVKYTLSKSLLYATGAGLKGPLKPTEWLPQLSTYWTGGWGFCPMAPIPLWLRVVSGNFNYSFSGAPVVLEEAFRSKSRERQGSA